MEQMQIDQAAIIPIDYEHGDLPATVRQFKPVVFQEGNAFCCILGPDPQSGIFGCGDSKEEAIRDWNNHFLDEIDNPTEGNETTRYILDNLNTF
jgi:hypothetical protein